MHSYPRPAAFDRWVSCSSVYGQGMHTVRVESWKVEIVLRELEDKGNSGRRTYYFATEAMAQLAIEWAYKMHVEGLRARRDVEQIVEYPELDDGSWKLRELSGKKVTWYKSARGGFYGMKDYFTYQLDVFERTIIGDPEPPPIPPDEFTFQPLWGEPGTHGSWTPAERELLG